MPRGGGEKPCRGDPKSEGRHKRKKFRGRREVKKKRMKKNYDGGKLFPRGVTPR